MLVAMLATLAHAGDLDPEPYVLLQVWGTVVDQDVDLQADPAGYGDPEADPGVGLQRARVGLWLEKDEVPLHYALVVGAGAPYDVVSGSEFTVGIIDAYVGRRFAVGGSRLDVVAGSQKVPLSRDFLQSAARLVFQERSVSSAWLAPQREVGLAADLDSPAGLRARAGVYSGNGLLSGDTDPGVMTALRLEYASNHQAYQTSPGSAGNTAGVALSGLYNFEPATNTLGAGLDGIVRFGPVTVTAEALFRRLSPGRAPGGVPEVRDPTTQLGGSLQVSGWLPIADGGVEIAARGAYLDDQVGFSDNGDLLIVHAGATWRDVWPGVDLGATFVHREELGGRRFPNDTARLQVGLRYPFTAAENPTADR
jgi:hypothetical protein